MASLSRIILMSEYDLFAILLLTFFLKIRVQLVFFYFFSPDQTNKWNRFPLRFLVNRLVKFDDDLLLQTKNRNEREMAFNWHYFTLLTSRASPSLLLFPLLLTISTKTVDWKTKHLSFKKVKTSVVIDMIMKGRQTPLGDLSWIMGFCRSIILRRRRKILIKMQHLWLIDKTKKAKKAKNILKKDIDTFLVIGKHYNCLRKSMWK